MVNLWRASGSNLHPRERQTCALQKL